MTTETTTHDMHTTAIHSKPSTSDLTHGIGPTLRAMRRARNMTQRDISDRREGRRLHVGHQRNRDRDQQPHRRHAVARLRSDGGAPALCPARGRDSEKPLLQMELNSVASVGINGIAIGSD